MNYPLQAGDAGEFLEKLLHTDATLDEGTVPDIKVMDTDINMMSNDVNTNSLLDFFNQITSKSSSSLSGVPIKEEPLTEEDLKAFQKDRQKKDNHNLSELHILVENANPKIIKFKDLRLKLSNYYI